MHARHRDPVGGSEQEIVLTLLTMYGRGIFPMAEGRRGGINWYTADPRAIIPLTPPDQFHVPRSVDRMIRRGHFALTTDTDFEGVIRGCADPRHRRESPSVSDETWINETLLGWYLALHRHGHAHSLEAWRSDAAGTRCLVGGVYGVAIGAAFFAESMFHVARPRAEDGERDPADGTGASNACLARLLRHLCDCGYTLFDVQFINPHIERFGVREIPGDVYIERLDQAVSHADCWRPLPRAAT